jgi:hypothetical protein
MSITGVSTAPSAADIQQMQASGKTTAQAAAVGLRGT